MSLNTAAKPITIARDHILVPNGLDELDLQRSLDHLRSHQIDAGDIYFQYARSESWSLEDGRVKQASHSIAKGAGVRAVSGDKTGFAYSDKLEASALLNAACTARAIAKQGQNASLALPQDKNSAIKPLYSANDPIESLSADAKVAFLQRLDQHTRSLDPRVKEVVISLSASFSSILVARVDGALMADTRPLVRLSINVITEQHGRREQGNSGGGGRFDYAYFDTEKAFSYAQQAVRQALIKLEAQDAPAGSMTVVLGPGWPGVLLHEAVGHGLEGDFNRKGTSAFAGRIGEKVASEHCTVVDDGTLAQQRGSLTIDDEGNPTQHTVLIENGILKGYLQDAMNARLMNTVSTGNGRRQSYAHLPMPRMTNTFMLNGSHAPEDIIGSVKKGLYAVNFSGGQVDITNGKFVFAASEAYLIEDGKLSAPVKGATLIGNGPDALTRVSMVGNDLALDQGIGTCGKNGQSVPVCVGQPTLRIDELTVGGTKT